MNIVSILRERKEFILNGSTWIMSTEPDRDCAAAAEEIVRLRRALVIVAIAVGAIAAIIGKIT